MLQRPEMWPFGNRRMRFHRPMLLARAMELQEMKDRKAFCEVVVVKRKEFWKAHIARKKQQKELCKEIRRAGQMRALAWEGGHRSQIV